ncbi:AMP-binding protein [candidate division KSB3 bacterium]|uniref:AMP-binding protein n=1 Tax=candidate division KSB3 bacterium TaxID=2044937 RepID=A0A9D5JW89_9BACT|nr:AMP-binding protein [candidate division KSB3 bacterium]MBD3325442.1 AMP-binding protein [candidate division KSB3 bacterium]
MNTLNIAGVLEHASRMTPEKIFVHDEERTWTYRQIEAESQRFANVLAGLGIQSGEKVALLLPNIALYPICHYGALKRGAVPVPLPALAPGPEIAYMLSDADAVALVTIAPFVDAALDGYNAVDGCRHLIAANVPETESPSASVQRLEGWMAAVDDAFTTVPTRPDDPAVILYTAGTTGRPKGAVLTHFNYYFFSYLLARDLWRITADDVILTLAPASHIFGQAMLTVACAAQAQLRLMPKFAPKTFLQTIERDKVTFFAGVPTLGHLLIHNPQREQTDLSSLRCVMFGGAPMPPGMAEQIRTQFHVDVITGYGLTEGVPLTFITAEMRQAPSTSVGLPVLGTSIRVVNEAGQDVSTGEPGEIVARGPQVFQGYYRRAEESARSLRDEWFHTGDIGYQDDNGYLFLVDRLNDMIKTRGYTVFPAEVERVLCSHPVIAEAAVIGIPDEVRGEIVKAFVTLKPEATVSEKDLTAYTKTQLAEYKCPRIIEFRENLPKSPAGKILRRVLRSEG